MLALTYKTVSILYFVFRITWTCFDRTFVFPIKRQQHWWRYFRFTDMWPKFAFVGLVIVRLLVSGNPDAKRLYDDLLSSYNKLVRPVVNTSDVLRVSIKLKLSQLIDVVRKNAARPFRSDIPDVTVSLRDLVPSCGRRDVNIDFPARLLLLFIRRTHALFRGLFVNGN